MSLSRRTLLFTGGAVAAVSATGCSVTGASNPDAGATPTASGGEASGTVNIL